MRFLRLAALASVARFALESNTASLNERWFGHP
jgi:hypothetical protein